jgi:hypothetical protein
MDDFRGIDPTLTKWAQARGLHVYTGHKHNIVRSVTVYVWIGSRHESTGHIWLDPVNELGLVGLHAGHRGFRIDEAVPPADLAAALSRMAEALARHHALSEAR